MARPGDDDFEWSDFDFSDFEEELEILEREDEYRVEDDLSDCSDSEKQSSAVTSAAANSASVATSGRGAYECDVCGKVYKNAGWLGKHKSKEHPKAAETPQPGTSNSSTSDHTTPKGAEKTTKPRRKLQVKRPTSKFEQKDALQEGPELLKNALQEATTYPIWQLTLGTDTPGNIAARTATEVLNTYTTVDHTNFITTLCTQLWSVITAADSSVLCSAGNESMFSAYHKLCSSESFRTLWDNFMSSLGKAPCNLLYQFITGRMFEGLLEKKHNVDVPPNTANVTNDDTAMTDAEEQVLRYIAGYIPHALLKRYQKYDSKIAKLYVAFLVQWKVPGNSHSHTSFLKFTEGWVNAVNRGGLFTVSDQVYLFFRAMEKVVRSTVNTQQLRQDRLKGVKNDIITKLETDFLVNKYWCTLACNITDEKASVALLEKILVYYVNLRCRAFADAYILVKRHKDNAATSKKGEKSLRKSLNTSDC
ncbi:PREDICTED: uncharacterized protein LOC109464120 [Branchiostoma belcheri]|uniref:Uncharacterized protein LOC109464120 n=1 Tax=Branchiostoma belcheri TaxID=7741 RepID=A0A6P4XX01_BRABE|nr:PREDICTED: uncharacterized protein LOC109464120 [Branchiostoma belcheri]